MAKLLNESVAARKALADCNDRCPAGDTQRRVFQNLRWPYYIGAAGAAVTGGLLASTSGDTGTPGSPSVSGTNDPSASPQTNAPPTNTPPTNTPQCNSIAGTYALTGTLRLPRSCLFARISPIFATPISATMTLLVDASCSGTATVRHPNTWTFAHPVMVEASGSSFRVRSRTPFMSAQPFGIQFSSSLDVTTGGTSLTGTEVHQGPNCTDTYDLTGSRTGS